MADTPVHIGTDRQLFLDDFWIDEARGTNRVLHEPTREAPAIEPDRTWDLSPSSAGFMEDGGLFRAWYRTDNDPTVIVTPGGSKTALDPVRYPDATTAYAESKDGILWEKPDLGLFEIDGSRNNSAIWMGPGANMVPFKDANPNAPDDERYKAVVRTNDLLALGSPDGIHWHLLQEEPIMTERALRLRQRLLLGRLPRPVRRLRPRHRQLRRLGLLRPRDRHLQVDPGEAAGPKGSRATSSAEASAGYAARRPTTSATWSDLELIDTGETPDEHHYTNACVKYERTPNTYLMFPSRFVVDRTPDPTWTRSPGVNDIVFMSSRDGIHFDRSFKEAFIRPGLDRNNWHDRSIYLETGILQTSPTELSLYGKENAALPTQRIRRYSLRTDGFVSVNAGHAGGELVTSPFTFDGSQLELNYSTSAVGTVKVELQDGDGIPHEGFSLDDCPDIFGDEIEGVVHWGHGPNVSSLTGKPVRLRFWLKDADIYAFKFNH